MFTGRVIESWMQAVTGLKAAQSRYANRNKQHWRKTVDSIASCTCRHNLDMWIEMKSIEAKLLTVIVNNTSRTWSGRGPWFSLKECKHKINTIVISLFSLYSGNPSLCGRPSPCHTGECAYNKTINKHVCVCPSGVVGDKCQTGEKKTSAQAF